MELSQVIGILNRTVGDSLLRDGMGCSEPIISIKDGKVIDNFYIYYVNMEGNLVSGPIARIGIQADSGEVEHLIFCGDQPFSLGLRETMQITRLKITAQDFEEYEKCYKTIREVAYKTNCTDSEKKEIAAYLRVLRTLIAPEMQKLYEEMVPAFFEWVRKTLDS